MEKRYCKLCDKEFTPPEGKNYRYCSYRCYLEDSNEDRTGRCRRCKKYYKLETGDGFGYQLSYCSWRCYMETKREKLAAKLESGDTNIEPMDLIYLRDNYSCIYCGKNYFEDEVYVTIGYLIQSRHGGAGTASNVAVVCDKCNNSFSHKKDLTIFDKYLEIVAKRNEEAGIDGMLDCSYYPPQWSKKA